MRIWAEAEKLAAEHDFSFSSETLRKWMIADKLWCDRRQRKRIHQPRPPAHSKNCSLPPQ
jgi:hypothetical protein